MCYQCDYHIGISCWRFISCIDFTGNHNASLSVYPCMAVKECDKIIMSLEYEFIAVRHSIKFNDKCNCDARYLF